MNREKIQKSISFIGIYSFFLFVPFFLYAQDAWDPGSYSGFGLPEGTLWGIVYAFMIWILSLISLIAVIAFVISGMQYLLSAGNEKMIE
ncbi:MAG: hypothetical protein EOM19_05355, partial [Candidatus Moranbacteria bacterium]|nr:hypothetical protein [Candidatus Moranbacteria bacterium]